MSSTAEFHVDTVAPVETYLTVGFVPSAERASAYLDTVLKPVEAEPRDAPQLLSKILEDRTYSKGYREIVIPLTSGVDSRSLLGAALAVFNASAIRCITVGAATFRDCVEAAKSCRRVRVRHERIESSSLRWDMDELIALARERFEATRSFVTLETLVAFGAINERVDHLPIVSGFLGDAVSGKHLPSRHGRLDQKPVETSFLEQNRSVLDGRSSHPLQILFQTFVSENTWRLEGLPGATPYDLLDFGFRQSHYIRPNSDAFSLCVRPFEDPRWVSHWLSRPLSDRIGQRAYVQTMQRAFANVFGTFDPQAPSLSRFIRPLVPRSLRKGLRALMGRQLSLGLNRGDPLTNASMATVVGDLLAAFDHRRLLPFPTVPLLKQISQRADNQTFQIVRWASSAELHIRAGNLTV